MANLNIESTFIDSKQITDKVFEYTFSVPSEFTFIPGQFVSVEVGNMLRRSYSILDVEDGEMLLLVDVSPGGPGSMYFQNLKANDKAIMMGPLGKFMYKPTEVEKIFIATGTGVVPFIPMINEIAQNTPNVKISLYFGTRHEEENLAYLYLDNLKAMNFELVRCISKLDEESKDQCVRGRVTQVIPEKITDFSNKEFYLCGVNEMVHDVEKLLVEQGVDPQDIVYEKYG